MTTENQNHPIELTHAELVFTIEALRSSIEEKIKRVIVNEMGWARQVISLTLLKYSLDMQLMVYGRLLQMYMSRPEKDQVASWLELNTLGPKVWDLVAVLEKAETWEDVIQLDEPEYAEYLRRR